MQQEYLAWCRLDGKNGHEAGRELLRRLYAAHVGAEMPEIVQEANGKPCFADKKWHFSISHCRSHAFCVLSSTPVGVDAETLGRTVRSELAGKCLSPAEKARYDAAADKNRAFLSMWVLKEAQGKLSGRGIAVYPNDTDFSPDDPRVQQIDGCVVAIVK